MAVFLGACEGEKVQLVAAVSRELEKAGVSAADWIREPASVVGGSGGGRADMAQAGGKHPEKLSAALEAARSKARELLGK